jgi:hypothetical protein
MTQFTPEGFLSIREAADRLAIAMYAGEPDRAIVKKIRETEGSVADGKATDDAIAKLWSAVEASKIKAFLVGPTQYAPLRLTASMAKGIPLLRSPRGGGFTFLRATNVHHKQFVNWFGPDLSAVSVVFREQEIAKLERMVLRERRRRMAPHGSKKVGRRSRLPEVKKIIVQLIDAKKLYPRTSIKGLTQQVNRRAEGLDPFSEDTVGRALDQLFSETGDRRFERVRRQGR